MARLIRRQWRCPHPERCHAHGLLRLCPLWVGLPVLTRSPPHRADWETPGRCATGSSRGRSGVEASDWRTTPTRPFAVASVRQRTFTAVAVLRAGWERGMFAVGDACSRPALPDAEIVQGFRRARRGITLGHFADDDERAARFFSHRRLYRGCTDDQAAVPARRCRRQLCHGREPHCSRRARAAVRLFQHGITCCLAMILEARNRRVLGAVPEAEVFLPAGWRPALSWHPGFAGAISPGSSGPEPAAHYYSGCRVRGWRRDRLSASGRGAVLSRTLRRGAGSLSPRDGGADR